LQFVERSAVLTYASSARLEAVAAGGAAGYPEFYGLASGSAWSRSSSRPG